ncbi:MAG: hypothetical protein N2109_06680 [Fimbriimonadales bacterium]|nr:hypothetical protein [Fimbriimonadales bacterium]
MRVAAAVLGLVLALAGCGGPAEMWPLEVGRTWTYSVDTGLTTFVARVRVERRVPVGRALGYELRGSMGTSRLAWDGDELVASMLPQTRFNPPIRLAVAGARGDARNPFRAVWRGNVEWFGKARAGVATLEQRPDRARIGSAEVPATLSVVRLTTENRTVELSSWFVDGIGLVRQEQRTDGILDVRLEYLRGE